jgi:hypothetical protein
MRQYDLAGARRARLIRQRSPLVSVLVSFPSVPDRLKPFAHGDGERDGRGEAPGGRTSDDLLSGLTAQTLALITAGRDTADDRPKEASTADCNRTDRRNPLRRPGDRLHYTATPMKGPMSMSRTTWRVGIAVVPLLLVGCSSGTPTAASTPAATLRDAGRRVGRCRAGHVYRRWCRPCARL